MNHDASTFMYVFLNLSCFMFFFFFNCLVVDLYTRAGIKRIMYQGQPWPYAYAFTWLYNKKTYRTPEFLFFIHQLKAAFKEHC